MSSDIGVPHQGEQYDDAFVPDDREIGVGPHPEPWPVGPQYDRELLANGDRRNVTDGYRYWTHEAIVADLDTRRHGFHVAVENWQHDFNIGDETGTSLDPWRPHLKARSLTHR